MSVDVFTVLNATLPRTLGLSGQVRLWVTAASVADVLAMLAARGITYQPKTLAGSVGQGPFESRFRRAGLAVRPHVYAYPVPFTTETPILRVDSPTAGVPMGRMGEVLGNLVG